MTVVRRRSVRGENAPRARLFLGVGVPGSNDVPLVFASAT